MIVRRDRGPRGRVEAPGRRRIGLRSRLQRIVPGLVLVVVAGLLSVWVVFGLQAWTLTGRSRLEIALTMLGLAAGVALLARLSRPLVRVPGWVFLAGALAVACGLRLAWVMAIPTVPVSDFKSFVQVAGNVLDGEPHKWPAQHLGIVMQLVGALAVSGRSLLAARVVNVLWAVPTVVALLALGRRTVGEAGARVAVVLFALWPADIMLRGTFTTEIGFVPLYLGTLVLVIDATRTPRPLPRLALAGVLLAAGDAFRTVGALLVVVAVGWLVVRWRRPWRQVVVGVAVLGVTWAAFSAVRAPVARSLGFDTEWGWLAGNVLMGSNIEARGQWNQADSGRFYEALGGPGHRSGSRALRIAVGVAAQRALDRPWETLRMQLEKLSIVWSDDGYGAHWSTLELSDPAMNARMEWWRPRLLAISQYAYVALLALALAGAVIGLRRQMPPRDLVLPLLVVLAFVAVHVVLEAQSRYHYPWTFPLLLLAGWGVVSVPARWSDCRRPDRLAP